MKEALTHAFCCTLLASDATHISQATFLSCLLAACARFNRQHRHYNNGVSLCVAQLKPTKPNCSADLRQKPSKNTPNDSSQRGAHTNASDVWDRAPRAPQTGIKAATWRSDQKVCALDAVSDGQSPTANLKEALQSGVLPSFKLVLSESSPSKLYFP